MTQKIGEFTPGFGSGKFGCDYFPSAKPDPDSVVSRLISGSSVSVLGIRRIGKTSLLAETRERLRSMGKNVVWVDLDTSDTPAKALSAILGSMQEGESRGIVASIMDWVDSSEVVPADLRAKIGALVSGKLSRSSDSFDDSYVEELFQQTGRLLEAVDSEKKPIIIFDELTTLTKNTIDQSKPEETRMVVGRLNSFLGQLRHWRTKDVGITMAVSGSVSFNWLMREYGIRSDSINDCIPVNIRELDREDARKLLDLCIAAKSPTKWKEQFSMELPEFLPAFFPGVVQLAFDIVNSEFSQTETLNDAIRDGISIALWNQYFEQFDKRFHRYGAAERIRINKLFDKLEEREGWKIEGIEALKILNGADLIENELDGREIIEHLRSDSFIEMVTGGFRYSSGLVPAWRSYFGKVRN